ncbi:hypothetical protein CHU98_g8120 [Xylaria longipes]|nr:hypothetical protein CHU98_g8120 [Xylaria longipes]
MIGRWDHEDLVEANRELAIQVGVLNRLQNESAVVPGQPGRREQDQLGLRARQLLSYSTRGMVVMGAAATLAWTIYRADL